MRRTIVICLWLAIVSNGAFAADKTEQRIMPLNDGTSMRISYKNNGVFLIEYLRADGSLVNGDKESANGKIKIVDSYEAGILRLRKAYFENGQLWYSIRMTKNGAQPEMVVEYAPNGKLKDGEYKESYPNGKLKSVGHYKKGVPIGKFLFYCTDGELAIEREFDNGALSGVNGDYADGKIKCEGDPYTYFDIGFYSNPGGLLQLIQKRAN
ncbi:MAG: hypothetical protein HQL26_10980 [Candidatus Omnitrophica bacterium]|nr:hypothetical protein [Candidatus Omnitrophota bacterium]